MPILAEDQTGFFWLTDGESLYQTNTTPDKHGVYTVEKSFEELDLPVELLDISALESHIATPKTTTTIWERVSNELEYLFVIKHLSIFGDTLGNKVVM